MYMYMYIYICTCDCDVYIYMCSCRATESPIRNEDCGVHNYASAVVISPGTVGRAPA